MNNPNQPPVPNGEESGNEAANNNPLDTMKEFLEKRDLNKPSQSEKGVEEATRRAEAHSYYSKYLMEAKDRAEAEARAKHEMEAQAKQEIGSKTLEAISATQPEPEPEPEAPVNNTPESMPDKRKETAERAKKSPGIKKFLTGAAIVAISGAIAIATLITGGRDRADNNNDRPNPVVREVDESETSANPEREIGIRDGYGERGMWLSSEKSGPYDFASAVEVAEVCGNDEVEMIKYTAGNQVESLADYLANLPEQLQPEGFRGLSILEAEQRLESLSPEEYNNVLTHFNETMDGAFTQRTTLNGNYQNAYMREKDENGSTVHENMESVACTTHENNLVVNEYYWTDDGTSNGNVIGSMIIKITYDANGDIAGGCMQVVNPEGSRPDIYEGLPDITPDTPPTPSTPETPEVPPVTPPETPPVTPPETIAPKDEENITRIDNNILGDIAEDVGTGEVTVSQTPTSEVESQAPTPAPAPEAYEGTSATTVPNSASTQAETVAPTSPANDYSQNRGGANADEYAPVQANEAAQQAADQAEIPVEQAPTGGQALDDILGDLGIN